MGSAKVVVAYYIIVLYCNLGVSSKAFECTLKGHSEE